MHLLKELIKSNKKEKWFIAYLILYAQKQIQMIFGLIYLG